MGDAGEVEFLGEVAGGDMILGHLAQRGSLGLAAVFGAAAARVKKQPDKC